MTTKQQYVGRYVLYGAGEVYAVFSLRDQKGNTPAHQIIGMYPDVPFEHLVHECIMDTINAGMAAQRQAAEMVMQMYRRGR